MASVRCYEQQQQQHQQVGIPNRPQVEYFYVYVAESEYLNTGNWILLEPDKSLSLVSLRSYYATCFGIKYKFINAGNEVETRYIRYHNGYFRFPPGLDMNNTRFVAYYYNDKDDVNAFMEMAEANDDGSGTLPALEFKDHQPAQQQQQHHMTHNDSTLLGRTAMNFEMDKVLVHGAQSTPNKSMPGGYVSSTSDVILQEKTVEVISVHDSRSIMVSNPPPPPPPGPPQHQAAKMQQQQQSKEVPPVLTGVKAKLGPSVSSTSDEVKGRSAARSGSRNKRDSRDKDSSGFQREKSSVMIKPEVVPKSKNMLNRYQQRRSPPEDVSEKTPLKITLNTRGHQTERNAKILKIEDEKGRTTALLTKRKWGGKPAAPAPNRKNHNKRRYEPEPEEPYETEQYEKRRRYDANQHHQQYYRQPEARNSPVYDDYYRTLNVLLVGFNTSAPDIHETTTYFSEFGTVQDLHLYTMDNRHNHAEYYAFMTIRTDNGVSLFSDRHLYNGTVIYAIRVDGDRLPSRVTCQVCGYQGINVGYLHYHLEGYPHQSQLQKRLDSLAVTVPNVYRDSYYRMSRDEVYVQYPNDAIQELVRNDYWKRTRTTATYSSEAGPSNRYYSTERERYY